MKRDRAISNRSIRPSVAEGPAPGGTAPIPHRDAPSRAGTGVCDARTAMRQTRAVELADAALPAISCECPAVTCRLGCGDVLPACGYLAEAWGAAWTNAQKLSSIAPDRLVR
jgi:hypothetical protein